MGLGFRVLIGLRWAKHASSSWRHRSRCVCCDNSQCGICICFGGADARPELNLSDLIFHLLLAALCSGSPLPMLRTGTRLMGFVRLLPVVFLLGGSRVVIR